MPFEPAAEVLSPYTVLDLTRVRAGPTAVRQLADWGANVIKVELPATDDKGSLGGPRGGPDFQNLHRNKRSITLNLKSEAGLAVFKKLVERADVVVENYRPDVKFRLGIDYESLKPLNPRLIYVSVSGFGNLLESPYAGWPAYAPIGAAMAGFYAYRLPPDQQPTVGRELALGDTGAAVFAVIGG